MGFCAVKRVAQDFQRAGVCANFPAVAGSHLALGSLSAETSVSQLFLTIS